MIWTPLKKKETSTNPALLPVLVRWLSTSTVWFSSYVWSMTVFPVDVYALFLQFFLHNSFFILVIVTIETEMFTYVAVSVFS